MPGIHLSEGSIATIMEGGLFDKPIVQILGSKRITGAGSDRYRLLVSDGIQTHSFAMLATQLNNLVDAGQLENNTVICIDKWICNVVNNSGKDSRRVLILLEVSVLKLGSDVGGKIGNPLPYTEGGITQNQQVVVGNSANNYGSNNVNNHPPSPVKSNNFGGTRLFGNTTGNLSMTSPRSTNTDRVQTHPINSLSPYQNKWTVKVRVTNKSQIRTYNNARGEGKLFSMDFLDESGEMRATAFNAQVDSFYDMIEINKVYYISGGQIKPANKQFSSLKNDYEMTFGTETQVSQCLDVSNLPKLNFNFVKIAQLEQLEKDAIVDVIGICKNAADVQTIIARTTNRELKKRELQLVDQSNAEVTMTLWGTQAESFDGTNQPIIAVKGAKLSDFGGRSLSTLFSSTMQVNPDVREAHVLRGWFDNEGCNMEAQSISKGSLSGKTGTLSGTWKTLCEVKREDMSAEDAAQYFIVKGTIMLVRKENALYQACTEEKCNKKVINMNNGMYRCEKCNKENSAFKWRIILSLNLADYTDNQWVTCFQESSELILGRTSEELGALQEQDNTVAISAVYQEAAFKSFLFKCRVKMDTFNDETRLKTTVLETHNINVKEYCKKLIDDIKKMEEE